MAVLSSIMTSSSGRVAAATSSGFVFGLAGLSYPLLTWLDIVSGPLRPQIL